MRTIREGYRWKPDIFVLKKDDRYIVVKDYAGKAFVFRFFVGVFSNWREGLIYRKLAGLRGIPGYIGLIDRYAIAVSYISGRNAAELKSGELTPLFFSNLRDLVDAVHGRGVVLCDLRNIKNVIVGDDGEPYLIDFATAFQKGGRLNVLKNGLYRLFYQDDLLGIAKLKRSRAPHLLTREEELALEKGVFLQKQALFIKHWGRPLLQKIFGFRRIESPLASRGEDADKKPVRNASTHIGKSSSTQKKKNNP